MVELVPLAEVCSSDRPAEGAVALRGDAVLCHADFRAGVGAWRDALAARSGERWAIYFRDGYDFACALFGAWHAGKIVVLPTDAQPGTVDRLRPHVAGFIGEFPLEGALVVPDTAPSTVPSADLHPDTTALLVFTSGTTGEPAAIPKMVRQLDREIRALHTLWGREADGVPVLASVSHQHIYGLLFKVLWPLCRGAPFVSESPSYPEEIARHLARRPGVWIASPALLKRLPADLPWAAAQPHLRILFSSGGPLPFEAAAQCAALLGHPVVELYGSSETGGVAWRFQTGPQAPWRPFPGVVVTRCPERGVLAVRSPWVATDDAWLTADRGEVYPDGSFCLLGRADRIVKVEEKRVSLTALERTLAGSALAQEVRALVLPDGRVAAAAILRPEGEALLRQSGKRAVVERLRDWVRPHVEGVAIPRRWRFVEAFPLDAMGKVTDATLRSLFGDTDSRPRDPQVLRVDRRGGEVEVRLFIPADLIYFDGHFPQAPILPGVVQVEWAVRFARRFFDLPRQFRRLEMLKFQKVVVPEMTVTLALECLAARQCVAFRYLSEAGRHSSGRIAFGD